MKKNMGNIDRAIRVIIALLIGILFLTNVISGIFGIILMIFAVVFLLTSSISLCPLYILFGINTVKNKKNN